MTRYDINRYGDACLRDDGQWIRADEAEALVAELEAVVEAAKDVVFRVWDDDSALTYEEKLPFVEVFDSAVRALPA